MACSMWYVVRGAVFINSTPIYMFQLFQLFQHGFRSGPSNHLISSHEWDGMSGGLFIRIRIRIRIRMSILIESGG